MMPVRMKDVVGYALLPRFIPRIIELMPNLPNLAFLMAVIFESVGLLPKGHPLLDPTRMGTYGIRTIMAAGAANLKGGFKNADQYIIYAAFAVGLVILALQFTVLVGYVLISAAHATSVFTGFFDTNDPETDIAFLMLDRVFGIPEFFGSCYDPAVNVSPTCDGFLPADTFPTTFQMGLQALFQFYSFGILGVAGLMMVYYAFALLAETAQTGHPLGHRFQSFYSPVRLVLALILMLPLAYGYNTGQYITLWFAKWGSGFATNAWLAFNEVAGDNPMGMEPQELTGYPKGRDLTDLINFFYLVHTCKAAYNIAYNKDIQPYLVRKATSLHAVGSQLVTPATTFSDAMTFTDQGDIRFVFGEKDAAYTGFDAQVKPYCGEVVIPIDSKGVLGVTDIYDVYFTAIGDLWGYADMAKYGTRMAYISKFEDKRTAPLPVTTILWDAANDKVAGEKFYVDVMLDRNSDFKGLMYTAIDTVRNTATTELDMTDEIKLLGWGGAGVWFNKIVSYNGALTDAAYMIPFPTKYPMIMEFVQKSKKEQEPNTSPQERFSPTTASGGKLLSLDKLKGAGLDDKTTDTNIAALLNEVYKTVSVGDISSVTQSKQGESVVKKIVSALFGDSGLFDLRENDEVFPLARMATLGRSIINKSIASVGIGGVLMGAGGFTGSAGMEGISALSGAAGSAFLNFAMMGLVVGFILYYLIPFLPFLYFFMAVGRWVKTIFEAMVAIPIWALAHLRLGGDGIPGSAASQGYFLILEIFLRPICTIFGLAASLIVFAAQAAALDTIYDLVVFNVGGFDLNHLTSSPPPHDFQGSARESVDELFYTVMYAIILYMMAMTSFKLIDQIPNKIIRFAGYTGRTFSDGAGDPAEHLVQYAAYGANDMTEELKDIVGGTAKGMGSIAGRATNSLLGPTSQRMRMQGPSSP